MIKKNKLFIVKIEVVITNLFIEEQQTIFYQMCNIQKIQYESDLNNDLILTISIVKNIGLK